MFKRALYAASALMLAATASNAAIVSYSSTVMEIPRPANITNANPANNELILAFNEKQAYELTSDLTVEGGLIAAGTIVDSHMVLFNKLGDSLATLSQTGQIVFSGNILGVIAFRNTLLASDFLGAPSVYDDFVNRGLDEGRLDVYTVAGDTLDATFYVNRPGDWIRVITVAAVPVPAGGVLLPLGLAALFGLRRRRKVA